jgi:DNA polymerase I-like protein with 3'-5' exonuclease and polymerase domains
LSRTSGSGTPGSSSPGLDSSGLDSSGLVVDLEWDPQDHNRLLVVGWTGMEGPAYAQVPGNVPRSVRARLGAGTTLVEFTHSDAVRLLDNGYPITGPVVDLQVAAAILDENQKLNLDSIAARYAKIYMDKRLLRRKNAVLFVRDDGRVVPIARAPRKQLRDYCRRDVEAERDLLFALVDRLDRRGLLDYFLQEEVPFTRVLVDMERAGMPIDLVASEALRSRLEAEHAQLAHTLTAGLPSAFNLNSDVQVAGYIFAEHVDIPGRVHVEEVDALGKRFEPDKVGRIWATGTWPVIGLGLDPDDTDFSEAYSEKTGKPSVSKTALRMNRKTREHPWVVTYLEYQRVDTILTVFLRKFAEIAKPDESGAFRIYGRFNQTGARTGRLSSSEPNMQNVPKRGELGKEIRGLFRAVDRDHPFLMGDYSQLETRLMAHFSGDPELRRIFVEGRDPFIELGSKIFGKPLSKEDDERSITKNLWYAQGYGAWPLKISEMLSMEGYPTEEEEAEDLLGELQGIVPVYFEWRDRLIETVHEKGYITTLAGRRRRVYLSDDTPWKEVSHGERAAANAKVQGSAADIVRRLMVRFSRPALRLLLQVHDEVLYEYLWRVARAQRAHDAKLLQRMAETGHGFKLEVPLVFEPKVGMAWGTGE